MLDEEFKKRIRFNPDEGSPDFTEQNLLRRELKDMQKVVSNNKVSNAVRTTNEHSSFSGPFDLEDMSLKHEEDGLII